MLEQGSMKLIHLLLLPVMICVLGNCNHGSVLADMLNRKEKEAGLPYRWVVKKSGADGGLLERDMIPMPVIQTQATDPVLKRDILKNIAKMEGRSVSQPAEVRLMPDPGDGWTLNEVWILKSGRAYVVKTKPSKIGGSDIRIQKMPLLTR